MSKSQRNSTRLPYDFDLYFDIKIMKDLKEHIKQLEWDVKTLNSLIENHKIPINKIRL